MDEENLTKKLPRKSRGLRNRFSLGWSNPKDKWQQALNKVFVWWFYSNENKNTQPFCALLCFFVSLAETVARCPPFIHRSDFSSGSRGLCKSNLCLNSEACLCHHCCGSGNDINRTEDLIEVPWILILGETEPSKKKNLDWHGFGSARNCRGKLGCGGRGVWGIGVWKWVFYCVKKFANKTLCISRYVELM